MSRILVIDDDYQMRQLLRRMLETTGHEVIEACNGNDGIDIYREKGANVVITDIIMPEKEGLETIRELRQSFGDVKIIAYSAGGRLDPKAYLDAAAKFGAAYTFDVPFSRKELLNAVDDLLDGVCAK